MSREWSAGAVRERLGFVSGMTWGWTGVRGTWATPAAEASLDALAEVGARWNCVTYAALQDKPSSTEIHWRDEPTVTDDEVRWAIRAARERGQRVMLKPVVNCADGTWRAFIGFFEFDVPGEPGWADWWESYTAFILHHARIAEEEAVELFVIGCEMVRADRREAEWRELVRRVRAVYSGPITYNCDKYQEDRITWWDAVDVISASGYYPSGAWPAQLDRIEEVVRAHGKPFLFIECGCPSREGAAQRPNDWTFGGDADAQEQADYLAEMFAQAGARDWVDGFVLWDWPAQLYPREDALANRDYCMFGKPGATVVREFYDSRS
ncbi:glycoside hydrolase family 113 [Microbacterium paludicola]|uniref:glycoside hydrolase family 113 n=1 Tax=Microbacterium paludicola TaxID=300019 RepID=UPI00387A02E5